MEVYVADSAGTYRRRDILDYSHTRFRGFDKNEKFEFVAPYDAPIRPLSWVRAEDGGGVVFRGATGFPTGGVPEESLKWPCLSIPEILKMRYTWPMRYGAPNVVEDYEALSIAQIMSSGPPNQAAEIDQYVPGAIWMANSYFSVSPESQDGGVWYFPGWGLRSRASGRDVYIGGRLCAAADDADDVDSEPDQFFMDEDDLYVYGVGVGDIYGPVCIDGAFDYGLRWGNVTNDGDYLLNALDIGIEPYWTLIEKFLYANGIYATLRHTGDLTYLDGDINPPFRGSAEQAAYTLRRGDWTSLARSAPRDVPPATLIGLGAGENVTRVRYALADPTRRGPWIEQLSEHSEGQIAPKGRMDDMIDVEWLDVSSADFWQVETALDYFRPGDWLELEVSEAERATAQISEIRQKAGGSYLLRLGGRYAGLEYAYLEAQESLAVANLTRGQQFGSQEASTWLGPADTYSISWEPVASTDRDTADIRFSLWATEPTDCDEQGLAVTATVTVKNTLYPAGRVIAVLPWMPWGADPMFIDLPIGKWCALDGTEETIEVDVVDPSGNLTDRLGYTGRITGIGRYGQTPIASLWKESVVSSTLDGDIPKSYISIPYGCGTKSGTGLYAMTNAAAPDYPFKIVLRSGVDLVGYGLSGYMKPFIKIGGTVYYGTQRTASTTYTLYDDEWKTNPATSAPWTQSDVNDIQAGVYLYCSYTRDPVAGRYREIYALQKIELR